MINFALSEWKPELERADIPKEDISRRFGRSLINFWHMYRSLAHQWLLYYNTEDSFQEVAHQGEDEMYIYDEPLFDTFKQLIKDYE